MNVEAWNKVEQTHDLFKKIIAPLKQHLGISFGYMIVFNDSSYYQIINCMRVATTVYAADNVMRMLMDVVPSEMKEGYLDPIFEYIGEIWGVGVE